MRRVRVSRSVPRPAPSNVATSVAVATAPEAAAAARPALSARAPRTRALPDGTIESLLSEKADGLSAAALSKLTGAGYARVTARLRDLEQGGKVKSSGARRISLWRMVTDEERIAERATALENAQGPTEPTAADRSPKVVIMVCRQDPQNLRFTGVFGLCST